MERYDSYKDSGIIWVGQTPQHWSEQKIKFLFKEKRSTPNMSLNCGSISFGKVVFKDDDSIPSSRKETYQEVIDGEFLINPLNLNYDLKSLRIARSDKDVVVSPGYMVLQLQGQSDPKFFEFLLHVFDTEHMKSLGSGVRQTISFNHLKTERLPLPPIDEQRKIGQFLDRKTTLIDSLIEKTVRKIELLKEKRTSLINEVVTKGLNPDVEMKDSGVEWIGEIPSHWDINQLNRVTSKIANGYVGPTRGVMKSSGIKYIQGIHVENGFIEFTPDGDYYVTEEWSNDHSKSILHEGDVVMIQTGSIGQVGYVTKELEGANCHALIILRFSHLFGVGKYLLYFLMSEYSRHTYRLIKTGEILEHLNSTKVKYMKISLPPIVEQRQIGEYLDEQTSIIDSTITTEEKRIELLKEYRQSLISEVVTGKVKVKRDE